MILTVSCRHPPACPVLPPTCDFLQTGHFRLEDFFCAARNSTLYNPCAAAIFRSESFWRGGRVVYGTRFEIGRGVKLTVGSNPTLSAILVLRDRLCVFLCIHGDSCVC